MPEEIVEGDLNPIRLDRVRDEAKSLSERAMEEVSAIEVRSTIISKWVQSGLGQTAPHHWLDYGDQKGVESNPRPQDEAAIALARVLGAAWRYVPFGDGERFRAEPIGDGDYEVTVQIEMRCLGATIEEIGTATTDDGLLASGSRARDGHARMSDVRKKAMANAIVRALLACGLRPVTWAMLEKAGIPRAKVPKVGFRESEGTAEKSALADIAKTIKCPECGKAMRVRTSARGDFLGCTGYPECKKIINADAAQKLAAEQGKAAPQTDAEGPAEEPSADAPTNAAGNGKSQIVNRLMAACAAKGMKPLPAALVRWASDVFQRDVAGPMDLSEAEASQLLAELQTPAEQAGQETLEE